jgi:hypothetical protein
MFDVLACPETSFPTPNPADQAAIIPAPSDGSTFADCDAEDRLVDELLATHGKGVTPLTT